MKPGQGRLFFFGDRALYVGPGVPATAHAHLALQLCIPLSGAVRLRSGTASRWRSYAGALIPSNHPHESDVAVALIASIWLEPTSEAARALAPAPAREGIRALEPAVLRSAVPRLLALWRAGLDEARAERALAEVLAILAGEAGPRRAGDLRVARACELLAAAPARRLPIGELAGSVALSPSRLSHLLRGELGLPARRYSLWLRLRDAVAALARGASVTGAAHGAGFADAAHLSRTFRRMVGFPPSAALRVSQFVQAGAAASGEAHGHDVAHGRASGSVGRNCAH